MKNLYRFMAVAAVAMFTAALAQPAQAKVQKQTQIVSIEQTVELSARRKHSRHVRHHQRGKHIHTAAIDARGNGTNYCPRGPYGGSTSLARIVEPLKSKIEDIVRKCGAIVVSTDCRGGMTPNHKEHKAVDVQMPGKQSPTCIYSELNGWPGGVSTDYWSAPGTRHVHVSYSRAHEWGLRFAHNRGGSHYAHRRGHQEIAAAGYRSYQMSTP